MVTGKIPMVYPGIGYSATELDDPGGESDVDPTATRYAEELRAIGQALEPHGPFIFVEIERQQGGGYWVHAQVDESDNTEDGFCGILKRALRSLGQSDPRTIEKRYSAEQVQKLIQDGQARRRVMDEAPDFFSLSQILRVAGAHVDAMDQSTLIGVSITDHSVTFRYSQIKESQYDLQFIYNSSIKKYLRRKHR